MAVVTLLSVSLSERRSWLEKVRVGREVNRIENTFTCLSRGWLAVSLFSDLSEKTGTIATCLIFIDNKTNYVNFKNLVIATLVFSNSSILKIVFKNTT